MPVIIGWVKVNTITNGAAFNLPAWGPAVSTPISQTSLQLATLIVGDADPSWNLAPVFDQDVIDGAFGATRGI